MSIEVRTNPNKREVSKEEFIQRFRNQYIDPRYEKFKSTIDEMAEVAWKNHSDGRKEPLTAKAGDEFSDPDFELSKDWLRTKEEIQKAQKDFESRTAPNRVLIVSGSDRNDQTCPGEYSKTRRLVDIARETLESNSVEVEVLDLSLLASEYGRTIHPCKACVSTAMPLCHWPCSCYPNYALGQVNDWMNDIYPMWVRAHGVLIVTPVYWYQAPSSLKLMIDRLVCADGGNPDPTTTQGKTPKLAKELELKGWHYPKHLEGRYFGVIVHGDATGANELQSALSNWLKDIHMLPCPEFSELARYVGYYEPYATSHDALDKDNDFQQEVSNAALGLMYQIQEARRGESKNKFQKLENPRKK